MNILFITCSRIGDAVLTTPILRFIEKAHPNAKVTIAADPLVAPLFTAYPLCEKVIPFSKRAYSTHWPRLWWQTVRKKWDWVIDLRGSAIAYGLYTRKRSTWKQIPGDTRHKVAQLCATAGIPLHPSSLWASPEQHTLAQSLITAPTLAVAPAANWVGKQWPLPYFKHVCTQFMEAFPGAAIALLCAPHERPYVLPLLEAVPPHRLVDCTKGQYDLSQIGAILQQCSLFIGNDSGLMHMAAAAGTSTIGLFGPSRENNYGPWELPTETPQHQVIRIPLTYDELAATPGFSHKAQVCYMENLKPEIVWDVLKSRWESVHTG